MATKDKPEESQSILRQFLKETTFHGPNHAIASKSKCECGFWLTLYVVFLGLAVYQSVHLVKQYQLGGDQSMLIEKQVPPSQLGEKFHFTVCPAHWLDYAKVKAAVDEGYVSYANILFALSVVENLDDVILKTMDAWDISESDRVWGLQKKSCKPSSTTPNEEQADGQASPVLSSPTEAISRVVDGAKDAVDGVSSVVGSVEGLLGLDVLEPVLNGLTDTLIEDLLENLASQLCGNTSCRSDWMFGWKDQSHAFKKAADRLGVSDLTEFLALFAVDDNPVSDLNAPRVRYEVHAGQLCQVVAVNGSSLQNGELKATTKLAESLSAFFSNEKPTSLTGSKVFVSMPVSVDSSYDEQPIWSDLKTRVDSTLPVVSLLTGRQPVFRTDFSRVTKIVRKPSAGCVQNSDRLINPPKGYGAEECRKRCTENHTTAPDITGFRLVTKNTVGRIKLDVPLAPGRFVEEVVDTAAVHNCVTLAHCELETYCEEWFVAEPDPVTSGILPPPALCGQDIETLLNKFHYSIRILKAIIAVPKDAMTFTDFIGMIGGILGLYLGCSLFTCVHMVYFFANKLACGRRGRKKEVVNG